jgi:hypothetical protein
LRVGGFYCVFIKENGKEIPFFLFIEIEIRVIGAEEASQAS